MKNITAIIVSYKQTDLLQECFIALRKFYPDLPVIIIDGSPADSDCWTYSMSLNDKNTLVKNVEYNIGHGKGMRMGIGLCETDFFLLIDSDVVILKPGRLEYYLNVFKGAELLYGIGQIVKVNEYGSNETQGFIEYLHPHFCLVKKEAYLKYDPLIHHGAPMINAMKDLHFQNEHFLLNDVNLKKYISHKGRGTRTLNPPEFSPATWEK